MRGSFNRLAGAWLVLAVLAGAGPALAEGGLAERFGIGGPKVHHIVLLDTSGSMKPHYEAVKDAVRALFTILPGQDTLSLYRFDNFPEKLAEGALSEVDFSGRLPESAAGERTDIGQCLSRAMDEIAVSKADVHTVFFLTDGKEHVPSGSPFEKNHDGAWAELADRGVKVCKDLEFMAFGVGLVEKTDVTLLAKAFPADRVETVTLKNPTDLQGRLEIMAQKVRERWLKKAVQAELENYGVEAVELAPMAPSGGRMVARYAVKSAYPHLPLTPVRVIAQNSSGIPVRLDPPPPYTLGPDTPTAEFSVIAELPAQEDYPWWGARKTVSAETAYELSPSAAFADAEELTRLGFTPEVRFGVLAGKGATSFETGMPRMVFPVLLAGPLFLLVLAWFWLRVPKPRLFGKIMVSGAEAKDIEPMNLTVLSFGEDGSKIVVPECRGKAEIFIERASGLDSIHLRAVTGRVAAGGKVLTQSSRETVKGGSFDVTVGGATVTLISMSPRRAPRRKWGRLLLTGVLWVAVLTAAYYLSPW